MRGSTDPPDNLRVVAGVPESYPALGGDDSLLIEIVFELLRHAHETSQ